MCDRIGSQSGIDTGRSGKEDARRRGGLEFEDAARFRDEIQRLKKLDMGLEDRGFGHVKAGKPSVGNTEIERISSMAGSGKGRGGAKGGKGSKGRPAYSGKPKGRQKPS